ncbi:MAG: eL32 family ribosomal protein, partial [Candidatus Methanodesulfokora sp.]
MQKKKKPRFINLARYWHLGSVKSWRKPRGIDNKQRLKLKSRPKLPGKGYKNPDEIRGLHPSGLKPIIVHNPKELEEFVGMYGADNILVYIA